MSTGKVSSASLEINEFFKTKKKHKIFLNNPPTCHQNSNHYYHRRSLTLKNHCYRQMNHCYHRMNHCYQNQRNRCYRQMNHCCCRQMNHCYRRMNHHSSQNRCPYHRHHFSKIINTIIIQITKIVSRNILSSKFIQLIWKDSQRSRRDKRATTKKKYFFVN